MTNIETLSSETLSVIDRYLHFKVGEAVCSVPYFNNKTVRARGALAAQVGKGSPKEIAEEVEMLIVKNRIDKKALNSASLKKLLVDNGIGIDCSALAYHILDAESLSIGSRGLSERIHFIRASGLLSRFIPHSHSAKNADVATLADDSNSVGVALDEARPGDMIVMAGYNGDSERDHILVIHEIAYEDGSPKELRYVHAVAYPEDGLYGSGIRQGSIETIAPAGGILDQLWKESGSVDGAARIFERARASKTVIRRLKPH